MKLFKIKRGFQCSNLGLIFGDNGKQVLRIEDKFYPTEQHQRGEGVNTQFEVDLMTGEINQVRVFFQDTYLSRVDVVKTIGDIYMLEEISEEEALGIHITPTISSFLENNSLPPELSE